MQHPSLKFILRLPNGEIQLASQPHLTNKKFLTCNNCQAAIIYSKGASEVTCTKCRHRHKVQKERQVLVACEKCAGEMELINFAGIIVKKCSKCGFVPPL